MILVVLGYLIEHVWMYAHANDVLADCDPPYKRKYSGDAFG
jgi:hypothetical protein